MKDQTLNGEFPLASFSSIQMMDMDEVQKQMSRLIRQHDVVEHGIHNAPTEVDYAPLFRMSVSCIRLGTEMNVVAEAVNDAFLVFTALEDPFDMVVDNKLVQVKQGKVVIVSPGMCFKLHGDTHGKSIVLNVERDCLETLLAQEKNINPRNSLEFKHTDNEIDAGDSTISRLMHFLHSEIRNRSPQIHYPRYLGRLEELVASSLIYNRKHNYSELLLADSQVTAPRYVLRAIDYIHNHASSELTLNKLAEVAATSPRSLVRGFQKYKKCSPMIYLRSVRLDEAHEELLRGCPEDSSVTVIAAKWGFYNSGRFAQAYRKRFGENPVDTLRRRYTPH